MSLVIRKPGILSTVQDLGRTGSRAHGINPSGVMDRTAMRLINTLLGNAENAAVIETHFPAVEIEFRDDTAFAIGGADLGAELDGVALRNFSSFNARKGATLSFKNKSLGNRACIGVAGGFELEPWLGSASTNLAVGVGGYSGRALRVGDNLECTPSETVPRTLGPSILPRYSSFPTVRVIAGGESNELTPLSEVAFFKEQFVVTNDSNRMGFRLNGPLLKLYEHKELVSAAVTFGTVQLLPDGQLVVLMADHQTTGGYPRIANVVEADLPLLAQLGPGDKVMFNLVSVEAAERAALRLETDLGFLRLGCR